MTAGIAGVAAIAFAGTVLLQNVIRAGAPANDASGQEVLDYYTDHRAVTVVLGASFVLSGVALAIFLGGALRRLVRGARPAWAITGVVGGVGVMAMFGGTVAADQALSVLAHGAHPDLGAVEALSALHNSVFTVLFLFLSVALLGLSRSGVAAGITPRAFERLGPIGFALLASASIAGPFIAAGEAMPLFALGGIGFVIWLAFLVSTGLRLVKEAQS
jgi:hypothetical protein